MISIKDVAKLANVSTATVSRVLNNLGGYSDKTRDKVQKVIDEYGYISNMAAKSLRQSKSFLIAIIVPDISNGFFSTLALNLEKEFRSHNYTTIICNTDSDVDIEKSYHRDLVSKMVDGIISISGLETLSDDLINHNIPIVCIDRKVKTNRKIPIIRNDDFAASFEATQHLINQGCKKILYVSSYSSTFHITNRRDGYLAALNANNLPVDYNLIRYVEGKGESLYEAEELVSNIINSSVEFDAIFGSNDKVAAGALYALKRYKISVPENVKIIGFDNSLYSQLPTPSISTVSRNTSSLALNAANTLINMINFPDNPVEDEIIIPFNLVFRDSSK